ncbi:hypothetical protein MVEN_01021100 [Mycena venus]|uniref:F-box domain-containing protein n=1 Tax=Mycena venus TaxID=2733690 RepID=A0A8H6YEK2_9AGAR|nr:hypothetical protein MVEN_01021100 [Mycena venus]
MPPSGPCSRMLSNRRTDYQKQHTLVQGRDGFLSFAPIGRFALTLPPEITSEIFVYCLPDEEFVCPNASNAPILLTHICRNWRDISLSTQALWRSLYIDYNWFGHAGKDKLLCDWLTRAGKMPLSLLIEEDPYSYTKKSKIHEDQLRTVLKKIGHLSPQWQSIWLCVFPEYFDDLFPVEAEFPQLIKLSVELANDYVFEPQNPRYPRTFPGYPPYVLKDARSLHEIHFYRAPWMLTIPKTLKIYGSEMINVSKCIDVLRDAPNLSSCTFFLIPNTSQNIIISPSPLLNLQDLTLSENVYDIVSPLLVIDLLRHLTLPALKNLALRFKPGFEDGEHRPSADISELIRIASYSLCHLEKLTLCFLPTSDTGLLQCLQCFRSIATLQLQLRTFVDVDDVLTRLTYDKGFLPRLESLHLAHASADSWVRELEECLASIMDEMLNMLSSRCFAPRYWHSSCSIANLPIRRFFHLGRNGALHVFCEIRFKVPSIGAYGHEGVV